MTFIEDVTAPLGQRNGLPVFWSERTHLLVRSSALGISVPFGPMTLLRLGETLDDDDVGQLGELVGVEQ